MRILVATSFFLFLGICVSTSIRCCDLTLSAFISFLCHDLGSMSRPDFCCQPPCFLVTSPLFMLRRHSVVLSLQAGRDSKLLVCLFSCRDVDIRSRPSIFFHHYNSCRNLKSMSRPSFLPIQSKPHFSISTIPFNFSISGRDLTILPCFGIYVATSI